MSINKEVAPYRKAKRKPRKDSLHEEKELAKQRLLLDTHEPLEVTEKNSELDGEQDVALEQISASDREVDHLLESHLQGKEDHHHPHPHSLPRFIAVLGSFFGVTLYTDGFRADNLQVLKEMDVTKTYVSNVFQGKQRADLKDEYELETGKTFVARNSK